MLHIAHPKLSHSHAARRRRHAPVADAHVGSSQAPLHSNAAPLTLAAIVVADLLLAVSVALAGALGG